MEEENKTDQRKEKAIRHSVFNFLFPWKKEEEKMIEGMPDNSGMLNTLRHFHGQGVFLFRFPFSFRNVWFNFHKKFEELEKCKFAFDRHLFLVLP